MDEEMLNHFRTKLREKALSLARTVRQDQAFSREKGSDAMDIADQALESYTKDFAFSKSSGDRRLLVQIREALERIDHDSYGICAHCEEPIELRRLEAVPWARYCLKCQSLSEKGLLES
jgi:DnaK suppressor protein